MRNTLSGDTVGCAGSVQGAASLLDAIQRARATVWWHQPLLVERSFLGFARRHLAASPCVHILAFLYVARLDLTRPATVLRPWKRVGTHKSSGGIGGLCHGSMPAIAHACTGGTGGAAYV
jgi:hypothetical protein